MEAIRQTGQLQVRQRGTPFDRGHTNDARASGFSQSGPLATGRATARIPVPKHMARTTASLQESMVKLRWKSYGGKWGRTG